MGLLFHVEPIACAASSITRSLCLVAIAYSLSISNGLPARKTGMIALVRLVIAASSLSRSMLRVTGSMSANTGVAPTSSITFAVATQEIGVVMTSSPAPMPAMRRAISMVQVPELKVRTGRPPKYSDNLASNASTFGPLVIQDKVNVPANAAMVAAAMIGLEKGKKVFMDVFR